MLAEERFSRILSIIEAEGSATIQELMTALDASESTVRRDLITMDENGELHLDGICLVAGLGGANRRSGTFDYYMSEPVVKDDAKGVGPFLLAYTEMKRLEM